MSQIAAARDAVVSSVRHAAEFVRLRRDPSCREPLGVDSSLRELARRLIESKFRLPPIEGTLRASNDQLPKLGEWEAESFHEMGTRFAEEVMKAAYESTGHLWNSFFSKSYFIDAQSTRIRRATAKHLSMIREMVADDLIHRINHEAAHAIARCRGSHLPREQHPLEIPLATATQQLEAALQWIVWIVDSSDAYEFWAGESFQDAFNEVAAASYEADDLLRRYGHLLCNLNVPIGGAIVGQSGKNNHEQALNIARHFVVDVLAVLSGWERDRVVHIASTTPNPYMPELYFPSSARKNHWLVLNEVLLKPLNGSIRGCREQLCELIPMVRHEGTTAIERLHSHDGGTGGLADGRQVGAQTSAPVTEQRAVPDPEPTSKPTDSGGRPSDPMIDDLYIFWREKQNEAAECNSRIVRKDACEAFKKAYSENADYGERLSRLTSARLAQKLRDREKYERRKAQEP